MLPPLPFDELKAAVLSGIEAGIKELVRRTFERSQELVPVDTHALQQSAKISEVERGAANVSISLSYGGESPVRTRHGSNLVDYAVVVHEDMEARHAPPTQAKYLEEAGNSVMGEALQIVGEAYDAAVSEVRLEPVTATVTVKL